MDVRPPGRTGPRFALVLQFSRLLTSLFTFALLSVATAQVCVDELSRAVRPGAHTSRVATALVRTAVEVVEPALPDRRDVSRAWDDPNAEWLDRHGLLPRGWRDDEPPSAELWARLLGNLQEPYGVTPRALSGNTDAATFLRETGEALQRIASAVRPLALVATNPGSREEIVSVSVIWNWTPWPRLLIFEPNGFAFDGDEGMDGLLRKVGTCAWQPRAYFRTDVNTAAGFYLGNAEARVRLLATDLGHSWELIPDEQEQRMFVFDGELLHGASVAAIGFEGPGPSTWQVMKFLTTAQTNVGAFDLPYYLALP